MTNITGTVEEQGAGQTCTWSIPPYTSESSGEGAGIDGETHTIQFQVNFYTADLGAPCRWIEIFIGQQGRAMYKYGETDSMLQLYGGTMEITWQY